MRVPETTRSQCRNRKINRFDSSFKINHKALETLPMATTRPPYTKLTCSLAPSPTTTGARGPRFHNRRRGANVHTRRVCFVRSQLAKLEEAQVVPPFHTTTPIVATGRNDDTTKPTVYCRRQWNPCHMDFDLVPASH